MGTVLERRQNISGCEGIKDQNHDTKESYEYNADELRSNKMIIGVIPIFCYSEICEWMKTRGEDKSWSIATIGKELCGLRYYNESKWGIELFEKTQGDSMLIKDKMCH